MGPIRRQIITSRLALTGAHYEVAHCAAEEFVNSCRP